MVSRTPYRYAEGEMVAGSDEYMGAEYGWAPAMDRAESWASTGALRWVFEAREEKAGVPDEVDVAENVHVAATVATGTVAAVWVMN